MPLASVSNPVDVANMALSRLGQSLISTMTESSRDATVVNALYAQNRDFCLMVADWDCLRKRQALDWAGSVAITASTAADPVVVTCSGHVFVNNELVYIDEVVGMTQLNGDTFRVKSATSNAISLYGLDGTSTDGTSYTAWVSGGRVTVSPGSEWSYVYDLPTDCMKVWEVIDEQFGRDESYLWRKERTRLYTNVENAGIVYTKQETDPSLYEPDLVEVIVARLAWFVGMRIHSDKNLRADMRAEYQSALARAKLTNAMGSEGTPEPEQLWSDVR